MKILVRLKKGKRRVRGWRIGVKQGQVICKTDLQSDLMAKTGQCTLYYTAHAGPYVTSCRYLYVRTKQASLLLVTRPCPDL